MDGYGLFVSRVAYWSRLGIIETPLQDLLRCLGDQGSNAQNTAVLVSVFLLVEGYLWVIVRNNAASPLS